MNKRWSILCVVVLLGAVPVLAQDQAAAARTAAGCRSERGNVRREDDGLENIPWAA